MENVLVIYLLNDEESGLMSEHVEFKLVKLIKDLNKHIRWKLAVQEQDSEKFISVMMVDNTEENYLNRQDLINSIMAKVKELNWKFCVIKLEITSNTIQKE